MIEDVKERASLHANANDDYGPFGGRIGRKFEYLKKGNSQYFQPSIFMENA